MFKIVALMVLLSVVLGCAGPGTTERHEARISYEADKIKVQGANFQISLPHANDWNFLNPKLMSDGVLHCYSDKMKMTITVQRPSFSGTAEEFISGPLMNVLDYAGIKSNITQRRFIATGEVPIYAWSQLGKPFYCIAKKTRDGHILDVMVSGKLSPRGLYPDGADLTLIEKHVKETLAPSLTDVP